MAGTIKNAVYRAQIVPFLIANLVVCWVVNVGIDAPAADWKDVTTYAAKGLWPSVGLIAASALNGMIDDKGTARIVFLRWADPVPGAEAFSHLMATDSRIDIKKLTAKHGPSPADPAGAKFALVPPL